ncbi:hypothetical protein B6A27_07040 [Anoxybacillus sp. UARK-01]|nr:hypothetical protein B6A27_07040 [Anoxybacillus sp. UARK-01]
MGLKAACSASLSREYVAKTGPKLASNRRLFTDHFLIFQLHRYYFTSVDGPLFYFKTDDMAHHPLFY